MSKTASQDGGQTAVGKCDNCGYVTGDDVDFNLPTLAECSKCGEKLESVRMAPTEKVRKLSDDDDDDDGGNGS